MGFLLPAVLLLGLAAWSRDPAPRWWKGNTHAHTLWSDGDGAPEFVADWYRAHGYQFLVLSDHNVLLQGERWFPVDDARDGRLMSEHVDELVERFGADAVEVRERDGQASMRLKTLAELEVRFERAGEFLLLPGEEITDGAGRVPVHVNGLGLSELVPAQGGASVVEVAEKAFEAISAQGRRLGRPTLAHLNHPNFGWAFTVDDLAALRGERFFELYNGHPGTGTNGDATHPSSETLWDLANQKRQLELHLPLLYGIASDDSHDHHALGPAKSNCGRGWIQVRARELTPEALIEALRAGEFYASSGVELADVRHEGRQLTLDIAAEAGLTYATQFIGLRADRPGVEILAETSSDPAVYVCDGSDLFVRAKVISSRPHPNPAAVGDHECAWTQPVELE